ncbi:MAG: M23 family metallopeptidase [Bacteroidota bacterium]
MNRPGGRRGIRSASRAAILALASGLLPAAIATQGGSPAGPGAPREPAWGDYAWPTDAGRKLTSTFAEFRRTHFHGGVDIGTGSSTGFRVFAMQEGYVERIRVSPVGYGKMLYLRHPDGFTTTYAHLERFAPGLEERVRREQRLRERYPVEILCDSTEFPVGRGDLVAFTGETGVGTPHLHFELRDGSLDFVNPLLCPALRMEDTIPPEPRRLSFTPLDVHSRVDGSGSPAVRRLRPSGRGRYSPRERVRVTGNVGIGIEARDLSNGSHFRHGVYRHDLFLDDSLLVAVRLDRAPNTLAQQIGLYYDWDLLEQGAGRLERLYVETPAALSLHTPRGEGSGILRTDILPPGPHELRIVTSDFSGNTSEVLCTLIILSRPRISMVAGGGEHRVVLEEGRPPLRIHTSAWIPGPGWRDLPSLSMTGSHLELPPPPPQAAILRVIARAEDGGVSPPLVRLLGDPGEKGRSLALTGRVRGARVEIRAAASGVCTSRPEIEILEPGSRRVLELAAEPEGSFAGSFTPTRSPGLRRIVCRAHVNGHPATASLSLDIHPVAPGDSGTLVLDGGRLRLAYGPASVWSTLLLEVARSEEDGNIVYRLEPRNTVLREGFRAELETEPRRGEGLYFQGFGRRSVLLSNPGSGVLAGRIAATLGELSLRTDTHPPEVGRIRIRPRGSARPAVSFGLRDALSGVDYEAFRMYIDGASVIPEIDGEHRRVTYQVPHPLARGPHRLLVRAADLQGNTRELEHRFTVR